MAATQTAGYLVFLLFIPVLSTIWIWMIVSKPAIIFHVSQSFFNFLAMCCYASVAAFQAHWKIGPSGLSGFAVFISVVGILFPLFLLLVPVVYEKYNKGARLARAMAEPRVSFIFTGSGVAVSLLISFIVTISAWTEPGCKDALKDPHASLGSSFRSGLGGWCSTKKAAAIFFWLAFAFWVASFVLTVLNWRNGKSTRPRDPPFTVPMDMDGDGQMDTGYDDEESNYATSVNKPAGTVEGADAAQSPFADTNAYAPPRTGYGPGSAFPSVPNVGAGQGQQPRPSIDAYGAFSDPAPTGFGAGEEEMETPRVSRTMQYADPYAAVRSSVAGSTGSAPPGYSTYNNGYP
ncbi:hypothetical protein BKA93DRAFT_727476 [Sparassis latifolia]